MRSPTVLKAALTPAPDGHEQPTPAPAEERAQRPLLISARHATAVLSISPRQLSKLIAAKQVPHVRIGRRVLFSPRALEEWIDARTEGAR